jgi:hypothetical protein
MYLLQQRQNHQEEGYLDSKMGEKNPEALSQNTMKFFIRHMSGSARRNKEREEKITHLDSQISVLRDSALSKRPNKEELDRGFDDLGVMMKDLVSNERMIAVNQQKEQREIDEVRERINLLEEKLNGLGHVHFITSKDHSRRIDEHNRKLQDLKKKIELDIESHEKELLHPHHEGYKEAVEQKKQIVIEEPEPDSEKLKRKTDMLNSMVREAEKMLRERGKSIKSEQAENIRRKIKIYKRRIRSLKEA